MQKFFPPISYHAVYDESILDALKYADSHGFNGIQVAAESPHLSFEKLSSNSINDICSFMKEKDLYVSLHGPDDVCSLFATSPAIVKGIMEYYAGLFDFAAQLNNPLVTIHLGNMTTFPTDSVPEQTYPPKDLELYTEALRKNLQQIIGLAHGRIILCVENYRLESGYLDLLQPWLQSGQLALCLDIPKLFTKSKRLNEGLWEFFVSNRDYIKQLHLHDMDSAGRSHRVIGSGVIDFKHFLGLLNLEEIRDACIEVRPREQARRSLQNLRKLMIDD